MSDPLSMWTVYDRPTDFPNCFVARRWESDAAGERATQDVIISTDLDELRGLLCYSYGLTCLTRSPEDDPKIVEVWL